MLNIVESALMVEQFRFPKSRKKRIRKKWAKRPENSRPATHAVRMGDTLVCHPHFAAALRRHVARAG